MTYLPPAFPMAWHFPSTVWIKPVSVTEILNYFSEAFFVANPDRENMAIWSDSITYH